MEGRSPVAREFEDDSSSLEDRMSEAYVPLVVDISADLCAARGLDVLAGDEVAELTVLLRRDDFVTVGSLRALLLVVDSLELVFGMVVGGFLWITSRPSRLDSEVEAGPRGKPGAGWKPMLVECWVEARSLMALLVFLPTPALTGTLVMVFLGVVFLGAIVIGDW